MAAIEWSRLVRAESSSASDERVPARALLEAADAARGLRRFDDAVAVYRLLDAALPDDPAGPLGLAEVALAQRDLRRAYRCATTALQRLRAGPRSSARAALVRGDALFLLDRPAQAVRDWRDAAELAPASAEAQLARERIRLASTTLAHSTEGIRP